MLCNIAKKQLSFQTTDAALPHLIITPEDLHGFLNVFS